MKLTIEQPKLSQALVASGGVVENRNTIPILSHVMLTASSKLSITATDMDIEAVTECEANVSQPGSCAVPSKLLADIVKRVPKGALIELELTGNTLNIKAGRSEFTLNTLPVDTFPVMATDEYDNTGHISADILERMLSKVKFAMSNEEARYHLNGVYMHNNDSGDLITVAIDGARLAKMETETDFTVSDVIIPRKTVLELIKLLADQDGPVKVETSASKMRVTGDGFRVVSKVVDGTFPEYTRVIPVGNTNVMQVMAKDFQVASTSVAAVSDARSNVVKLSVSGDSCELTGSGTLGAATSAVTVEYDGDPLDIGFNSQYLADMMAQAEGGVVSVHLGDAMNPALVKFDECPEFTGVVMPMRV